METHYKGKVAYIRPFPDVVMVEVLCPELRFIDEKERAKVKERIDKCNKERLLLLCQLLDIPDMKVTTKKEVVSAKLLEFLEFPHVTKSVVRAENVERSRKQKSIKESGQKVYGKGKAKVSGEPPPEPTEKEVRKFIIDWAKGIDFVKSVMGDLFRRLEDHFKMDLCDRKEELKHILTDIIFEEDDQDDDTDDSGGEDASRSGEDAGQKDAEGSDEDAGGEEDAEGSDEDAGEEEDAEGPSEDAGEEEGAEGSSEDAGEDEDPEGSDEDAGEEEDAEGSSEAGEEECAEGSSEDAGE
uniref:Golgin subfamily A member 6-like protein 2 n=1 Tax=Elaeis guineensis var. tenera TaxID=51953 RepID=A0A8N4IDL1_ELAGV|nr:golgin subfamily A member 6-like protein 2 [Elaeis guineensis]